MPLSAFHPVVREWFSRTFAEPTPPQVMGWPSIARGQSTLILAPTGSGKTLAAFLWALNHLVEERLAGDTVPGVRILYVSPLKALNNDIHRNLEEPLAGIERQARHRGLDIPPIRVAVRTGDTPQAQRARMVRHPPDVLITTPESLYLMLTSAGAERMFRTVRYLIVDEIHALCGNKRGVHLSLSIERLQETAEADLVRIGLSATQRPLERIAAFLGGQRWDGGTLVPRPVEVVDAGRRKDMDLAVECATPDFSVMPADGVWPLVLHELLESIQRHRTTLVFVNNRRLAERVAANLNQMMSRNEAPSVIGLYAVPRPAAWSGGPAESAPPPGEGPAFLVQAYHGSMSRRAREQMESDLKAGRLKALVATSSLELGIDIGSIDLVVQLQSPKGVARGLQRVGRSGHLITATSRGRIFPTHREDLVESAVVARAMREHLVEETSIPENCLDVLAQQVVAIVSHRVQEVDALFSLVRQSYCYRNLSRDMFAGVLAMLAGRYADETLRELRARISWDRVNNLLRPLPGSSRLATTGGGTIADRGAFGVYLQDRTTRVGEVDEEFVYETRVGDTFILGTSVWRVTEMDQNRLVVSPAPGQPARMPFWRGEGIGRSTELGSRVSQFRGELARRLDDAACLGWLQREFPIDARSAWNILEYFRKQRDACGAIPDDHTVVVEGFSDEIGDARLIVHSALGRRVNLLLGIVLERVARERTGAEPQMFANDDGVLLRVADIDRLPLDLFERLTAERSRDIVLEDLMASPLFGGQFRQNAVRALLMTRPVPGRRTPLWLQRLRAGDLLQAARSHADFPIVIETVREVLNDVLDMRGFLALMQQIERGEVRIHTVQTESPSPFSASLLFDFMAVYMYEQDQPRADRLSQYVALNRELLSEIVDADSLAHMLRPEAIETVEEQLQHRSATGRARSPEELCEILLRLGDLREDEIAQRCSPPGMEMLAALERDGRAVRRMFPDGPRWVAGEEAELYAAIEDEERARAIVRKYVLNRGPVTLSEISRRYGFHRDVVESSLGAMPTVVRGRFRPPSMPGAHDTQWCYRPNLERIHRQTLHLLRGEITPCSLDEYTRFLLHWQHVHPSTRLAGADGISALLEQLEGCVLPAEVWLRDVVSARLRDPAQQEIERVTASGEFIWVGARSGRLRPVARGNAGIYCEEAHDEMRTQLSGTSREILDYLDRHGASLFGDLRTATHKSLRALNDGLAELFWRGLITGDAFGEVLRLRRTIRQPDESATEPVQILTPRHNPATFRMMQSARRSLRQVPGWSGRWTSLRHPGIWGEPQEIDLRASLQASGLLARYGIIAREMFRREELLPWSIVASHLQTMELRGEVRRGYFVAGLSGMQFALPQAVEELRRLKSAGEDDTTLMLNACDPAIPYGAGVELNAPQGFRLQRTPSTYLILRGGSPVVAAESYGARLFTLRECGEACLGAALRCLLALLGMPEPFRPVREIRIEHWDMERPAGGKYERLLREAGFRAEANQTMTFDR